MNARDALTLEAFYLVLDFLRSGPCSVSADTLAAEAQRLHLLPEGASEAELNNARFAAGVPKGFLLDVLRFAVVAARELHARSDCIPLQTRPIDSLLSPEFTAVATRREFLRPAVPPSVTSLHSRSPLRSLLVFILLLLLLYTSCSQSLLFLYIVQRCGFGNVKLELVVHILHLPFFIIILFVPLTCARLVCCVSFIHVIYS